MAAEKSAVAKHKRDGPRQGENTAAKHMKDVGQSWEVATRTKAHAAWKGGPATPAKHKAQSRAVQEACATCKAGRRAACPANNHLRRASKAGGGEKGTA